MDVRRGIVRRKPAIWHRGDRIGEARVPEKVISRMLNQEAVVRDVDRLSHIHANRPARLVGGVSLAAVKHIEPVHAFRTRLRPARAGQEEHCNGGNNHAHFFHGTTSSNHMRAFVAQTSVCALFHPCKKSKPRRLNRLRKKAENCHSERRVCAKNPSWSFVFNRERFFASLRMTTKALFPQPVKPVPHDAGSSLSPSVNNMNTSIGIPNQ